MTDVNLTPEDDRPQFEQPAPGPANETGEPFGPIGPDLNLEPAPEEVSESQVRNILRLVGRGVHRAIGDQHIGEHWNFTQEELDDLAPAVVSLANRNARLRAAVHKSDAATVAMILFGWTLRNVELSRAIEEARQELEEEQEGRAEPTERPAPPEDFGSAQLDGLSTLNRREE